MQTTTVLIDTGHRPTTPGKRSPDGKLLEWEWAKACGDALEQLLHASRIPTERVPQFDCPQLKGSAREAYDLNERVKAANDMARGKRCLLVSLHCNAAQSGSKWCAARGWSIFIAPNASETTKTLAECIFSQAKLAAFKVRQQYATVGYWVQSLAICRDTTMPAVLIENFFMDNPADCKFLLSPESAPLCASVVARGIKELLRQEG